MKFLAWPDTPDELINIVLVLLQCLVLTLFLYFTHIDERALVNLLQKMLFFLVG
jgi:hypothetical protein